MKGFYHDIKSVTSLCHHRRILINLTVYINILRVYVIVNLANQVFG